MLVLVLRADVIHALLDWIHKADVAGQRQEAKPAFVRPDGSPIFPDDEEWWLTEFDKRKQQREEQKDLAGDDIPDEDLTANPHEAGFSGTDSSSELSEASDDGMPAGPAISTPL